MVAARIVLVISVLLELGTLTFLRRLLGSLYNPWVWTLAGIATVVSGGYLLLRHRAAVRPSILPEGRYRRLLITYSMTGAALLLAAAWLHDIYLEYPVDPLRSDIVPSIELYVKRLLAGEYAYQLLEFPGWTVFPNYLPLRWLPYVLAEWAEVDYRWVALWGFAAAVYWYQYRLASQALTLSEVGLKGALPVAVLLLLLDDNPSGYGQAVELLIVAYHLILADSLFKQPWYVAVGLLLCLLSRFGFVFWVPIYAVAFWMERGWRPTLQVVGIVVAGVLVIYVIPFLSQDWSAFLEGMQYYGKSSLAEWYRQGWQPEGAVPFHLSTGMSFSYYFYTYGSGDEVARYTLERTAHLWSCVGFMLLGLAGLWVARRRGWSLRYYVLLALKAYFIVFYGLFYAPYLYLYVVPFFVSVAVLWQVRLGPLPGVGEEE